MHLAGPSAHPDSGDRRTRFEFVYSANYESILAYALRRTQTRDDACDVVAETFLTAWRRLDQVPEGAAVRLWLYGVARLVLANHLRGQRRYQRLGARLRNEPTGAHILVHVADDDRRGVISTAFGRLRPDDQEILALIAVEGLTPGEIARVLGRSATTIRVRLHRARTRFARELKSEGVDV
jgi:RNA polymerase sigma-70 factor (ECF subfamily)